MTDSTTSINGLSLDFWQACYRAGMPEFAAASWAYTVETSDTVRLVFGNLGPMRPDGQRIPVFTNAVTIPASVAVELSHALLKHFAAPIGSRPQTSEEN